MPENSTPDPIPVTPGRGDMADIYMETLRRLKDIVASVDETDASRKRAAAKILEIRGHIRDLKKRQSAWARKYIPEAYRIGAYQDEKALKQVLGDDYQGDFTALHRSAAQVAAEGATADYDVVADALEKTFVGYIRRAQYEGSKRAIAREIAGGIVEGASRQTVSKRLLAELRTKAINGMITVGQVTMNAPVYAELLARTISRAARTEGTLNRLNENGIDLVIFNDTGAVDFCRVYENQIFSISGRSKKYPKLTARPPFHPNCTHVLSAFIEELADPEEIEAGRRFDAADVGKSARDMAKKYPVIRDDTRARTKKTQKRPGATKAA